VFVGVHSIVQYSVCGSSPCSVFDVCGISPRCKNRVMDVCGSSPRTRM